VQRGARELLEQDGMLAPPKAHRNDVEWVFRAEAPVIRFPPTDQSFFTPLRNYHRPAGVNQDAIFLR
jgi:hypothetical protein